MSVTQHSPRPSSKVTHGELGTGETDPDWPKGPLTEENSNELLQSMLAGAARANRYFEKDLHKLTKSAGLDVSIEAEHLETYVRSRRDRKSVV